MRRRGETRPFYVILAYYRPRPTTRNWTQNVGNWRLYHVELPLFSKTYTYEIWTQLYLSWDCNRKFDKNDKEYQKN